MSDREGDLTGRPEVLNLLAHLRAQAQKLQTAIDECARSGAATVGGDTDPIRALARQVRVIGSDLTNAVPEIYAAATHSQFSENAEQIAEALAMEFPGMFVYIPGKEGGK